MYCKKCGHQMLDEAVICPACGAPTDNYGASSKQQRASSGERYKVAKIFMLLGCIFSGFFYLIPLAWTIPMTVHLFRAANRGEEVGMGFKVCSLLFVNTVSGILLLCDK